MVYDHLCLGKPQGKGAKWGCRIGDIWFRDYPNEEMMAPSSSSEDDLQNGNRFEHSLVLCK